MIAWLQRLLQTALDAYRFTVAELLIGSGADPRSLAQPAEDNAAHRRLAARLTRLAWPAPPPSPAQVRALQAKDALPPARAPH